MPQLTLDKTDIKILQVLQVTGPPGKRQADQCRTVRTCRTFAFSVPAPSEAVGRCRHRPPICRAAVSGIRQLRSSGIYPRFHPQSKRRAGRFCRIGSKMAGSLELLRPNRRDRLPASGIFYRYERVFPFCFGYAFIPPRRTGCAIELCFKRNQTHHLPAAQPPAEGIVPFPIFPHVHSANTFT